MAILSYKELKELRRAVTMNGLLGNVEVVLGVRFMPETKREFIESMKWATHRKLYFNHKQEFHSHAYAWAFHSRVGNFAGFHASRVFFNPKTGYWHLSAHFSCNNFTRAVNALLKHLEKHVMPEGFAGYIIAEGEDCPVLIHYTKDAGLILQAVSGDEGAFLDANTLERV